MCAHKGESGEHGPSRPEVPALVQLWHRVLEQTWITQSLCFAYIKWHPLFPKVLRKFLLLSLCQQSTLHCLCSILSWKGPSRWESACSTKEGREMSLIQHKACLCTFTTLICPLPVSQYRWDDGKEQHEVIWAHQMEQEISLNCSWGIYLDCRFPW